MIEGKKLDKIMLLNINLFVLIIVVSIIILIIYSPERVNGVEYMTTDKGLECVAYVDDKNISGVSCNWERYNEEQLTNRVLSGKVCELVT